MNINSLYGAMQTTPTSNVGAVNQSNQTPSSIPPGIGGAASATISTPAQLFSEMQQLSQQNPSEFKAVAAQLATTFQSAASQATGPQAKLLTAIANPVHPGIADRQSPAAPVPRWASLRAVGPDKPNR